MTLRRVTPRPRLNRSTLILGGVVVAVVLSTHWIQYNISPSAPLGFYRLTALEAPPPVGTLVVLPAPAVIRPWWTSWWIPLLKPVAAVPGDEVCIEEGWLRVAGNWYGPVLTEAHGQPLPQCWTGCRTIAEGEVFLASDAPKSMDSRYFSSVPLARLTAAAVPLLTWR
jgi:type IV secretory pathway protease TraF